MDDSVTRLGTCAALLLTLASPAFAAADPSVSGDHGMLDLAAIPPASGAVESDSTDRPALCTADQRVCLAIASPEDVGGNPSLVVTEAARGLHGDGGTMPLPLSALDQMSVQLWNKAILIPGNAEDAEGNFSLIIGIVTSISTGYSGGGGMAERLHLHRLRLGVGTASLEPELVSLPLSGSLMIRACFGEEDGEQRLGACHDEYRFEASLSPANSEDHTSEYPQLSYVTAARAYPRTARRWEDSSTLPRLRKSDLSWWRDPDCSYTRTLRYNPATQRYEMGDPAPDCSSYTVP